MQRLFASFQPLKKEMSVKEKLALNPEINVRDVDAPSHSDNSSVQTEKFDTYQDNEGCAHDPNEDFEHGVILEMQQKYTDFCARYRLANRFSEKANEFTQIVT